MHSVQIFQNLFRLGKNASSKISIQKKQSTVQEFFQSSVLIKNWSKFSIFKAQCTIFSKPFSVFKKKCRQTFLPTKTKVQKLLKKF
jgi:hypothetical protein